VLARARGEHSHGGGYGPILPYLNRLKVHHLTMEFTAPQAGDMAVFKDLRQDLEIGLGCVDVTPGKIDSAETIADRVRKALKFLAPERITLNPDCGFAPGSGAVVSIDEAYLKLCNEAEAARILREEHG
jgi:5-methyltetrahydropteroyltriglutamate--homocysteine methyltransferase